MGALAIFGLHASNMKLNKHTHTHTKVYVQLYVNFTSLFFYTSCKIKKSTENNRKISITNAIHKIGKGVTVFSTYLQNELVM
jgi:hypothetical protein